MVVGLLVLALSPFALNDRHYYLTGAGGAVTQRSRSQLWYARMCGRGRRSAAVAGSGGLGF
jgi:hypothetical protein